MLSYMEFWGQPVCLLSFRPPNLWEPNFNFVETKMLKKNFLNVFMAMNKYIKKANTIQESIENELILIIWRRSPLVSPNAMG